MKTIGTPPTRQTAASYSIAIRLNGITTPAVCPDCQAPVTMHHGTDPVELWCTRHYFQCEACGCVGFPYPLERSCEHCRAASSEGGEVVIYHAPEPELTMTPDEVRRALYPARRGTAVQLSLFGG